MYRRGDFRGHRYGCYTSYAEAREGLMRLCPDVVAPIAEHIRLYEDMTLKLDRTYQDNQEIASHREPWSDAIRARG